MFYYSLRLLGYNLFKWKIPRGSIYFIVSMIILIILTIFIILILNKFKKNNINSPTVKGDIKFDEEFEIIGYKYDIKQDIFYTEVDAWQRSAGYCKMYDEAAAPFGIIIDCEPIYFDCNEKSYMIEFWKGQYGITTGGEIGFYEVKQPDISIPGVFEGTFYNSIANEELIKMSFILYKNGEKLFIRKERHWWLTGFKLGEFSNPSELKMDIKITFRDWDMCNGFIEGLKRSNYSLEEFKVIGSTVYINFDKCHSPQPYTRTKTLEKIVQTRNKQLCIWYSHITGNYTNIQDKLNVVKETSPSIYERIKDIGKPREMFSLYQKIRDYLEI